MRDDVGCVSLLRTRQSHDGLVDELRHARQLGQLAKDAPHQRAVVGEAAGPCSSSGWTLHGRRPAGRRETGSFAPRLPPSIGRETAPPP
jgi:hypothetical protein